MKLKFERHNTCWYLTVEDGNTKIESDVDYIDMLDVLMQSINMIQHSQYQWNNIDLTSYIKDMMRNCSEEELLIIRKECDILLW